LEGKVTLFESRTDSDPQGVFCFFKTMTHVSPHQEKMPMHSLLERQLRRAGFSDDKLPSDLVAWQAFLSRIERSYLNADQERLASEHRVESDVGDIQENNLLLATQWEIILNSLSDGLCAFDGQGKILFLNRAAQKMLPSYDDLAAVVSHLQLREVQNPDVLLSAKHLSQRLQQGQAFHDNHAYLQISADLRLPVACSFNPILRKGIYQGSVLLFSDIGELKRIETQLLDAKEKAERASQAKSQFLSSMSHELRTPMNAILGYGELLKEDLSTPTEEFDTDFIGDMQQYVANILSAGWHLLELINKVLDLTRIEAGKLEVNIEKVELIELIKECESLVSPLAEKRAITIHNETISSKPEYALIDRGRLKQVLINLLSNAVKYNHEKGEIMIRLERPHRSNVHLSVIDTGIGLTAEQKALVFEPFTRLSGLNLVEGTGIGLTITKRLLEMMEARIDVESVPGKGSRFWVELPTGEMDESDQPILSDEMRKYILLYVEDSRTNVSLVAQILKARPDIALMSAQTGEMGLELAQMHCPDVILLDINLPGMDGFEVLERLRTHEKTKPIPVLALSAVDTAQNLQRGKEVGFLSYIVKPLDIKKFLQAIDNAITQSPKYLQMVKTTSLPPQ
jgi:signal transduction histidine kinase/CheY-like chemotaxis protein